MKKNAFNGKNLVRRFVASESKPGLVHRFGDNYVYHCHSGKAGTYRIPGESKGAYFFFVQEGMFNVAIRFDQRDDIDEWPYVLTRGMYAVIPANRLVSVEVTKGAQTMIVHNASYAGNFALGGPARDELLPEVRDAVIKRSFLSTGVVGPFLETVHLASKTECQGEKRHQSWKVGIVLSGKGKLVTLTGHQILEPGTLYVVAPNTPHSLVTDRSQLTLAEYVAI